MDRYEIIHHRQEQENGRHGYEEIFKSLPADEQKALLEKKGNFAVMAEIE